jgi:putative addiction module killer protein
MLSIRPLPGFTAWIDGLKDKMVRGVVLARIKRLEQGLMGDVSPVGDGVSELRIHLGAGWGIYFTSAAGRSSCCLLAGRSGRRKPTSSVPRYWRVC